MFSRLRQNSFDYNRTLCFYPEIDPKTNNMYRKFRHFFKQKIQRNFFGRVVHLIFNLGLVYVLIQPIFKILNDSLVMIFIPGSPFDSFTSYLNYPNILILYATLAVVLFNLSLFSKKISLDFKINLFWFVSNLFLGYYLIKTNSVYNWPWFQTSILILSNLIFAITYKSQLIGKENKRLKHAFSHYTHPEVIEDMITFPEKLDTGGEQRDMTVLFTDLRGFTTLAESIPPKKLISILNEYFDEMSTIILAHKGTIDKYIGDAIMAFWNAPLNDSKHASNALIAAVEMVKKLNELHHRHPDFAKLKMGVGINSGKMIVGNLGSKKRFEYTVIGDNVNLGSRLESLTKNYGIGILLSEITIKHITTPTPGIIFRQVDQVIVKGKTEGIKIFQPLPDNQHNQDLIRDYHQAFKLYQKGSFRDASLIFERLRHHGDPVSKTMLERIPTLQNDPSWNGVWSWTSK